MLNTAEYVLDFITTIHHVISCYSQNVKLNRKHLADQHGISVPLLQNSAVNLTDAYFFKRVELISVIVV